MAWVHLELWPGSADRYFQEDVDSEYKLVPEGVEGRVPYKGQAADVIYQLVGGLKSSMGYCGAKDLNDFHNKAKFIKISQSDFLNHILIILILQEKHLIMVFQSSFDGKTMSYPNIFCC